MKKVNQILLVDDNPADNEFHTRAIVKSGIADKLQCLTSCSESLEYLRHSLGMEDNSANSTPNLLFLDLDLPGMNGFEFLDKLIAIPDPYKRKGKIKIFILTGSINPDDVKFAMGKYGGILTGFRLKPLMETTFADIVQTYF